MELLLLALALALAEEPEPERTAVEEARQLNAELEQLLAHLQSLPAPEPVDENPAEPQPDTASPDAAELAGQEEALSTSP